MMSLPFLLRLPFPSQLNNLPYLTVDPTTIELQKVNLCLNNKLLNVGIVWAGSKRKNDIVDGRSRSLDLFQEILTVPNSKIYSLQIGDELHQIENYRDHIIDLSPYIEDFYDTAAIIQNLDIVVTVDTSVAHLAAALGKRVFVLIPFEYDWRWGKRDNVTTDWYPNVMTLFRQKKPFEWEETFKRVANELHSLTQAKMEAQSKS